MRTAICPACGCSLVRLGIPLEKAATYSEAGADCFPYASALSSYVMQSKNGLRL